VAHPKQLVAALAFLALAIVGCASADRGSGEPPRGHALAERWCSECHHVSPQDPTGMRAGHVLAPSVTAPDFAQIAQRPYADEAYLERFMGELHLPMPIYRLSQSERSDLVAYILSLK
jgi:mono/diheme cytochrome c family protein